MAETKIPISDGDESNGSGPAVRAWLDSLSVSKGDQRPRSQEPESKFVRGLKTFLWVAPLTILIWIYAEREQIAVQPEVQAHFQIQLSNPAERIAIVQGENPWVTLELEGPRNSLETVQKQLLGGQKLNLPVNEEPGFEGDVAVAERIARDEFLTKAAVKVKTARPSTIHVKIERKQSAQLPILTKPTEQIVGTVVFEPSVVNVAGPSSVFSDPGFQNRLAVHADMSRFQGRKPGDYDEEVKISLNLPSNESANFTLDKKVVRAKVKIQTVAQGKQLTFPVVVAVPAVILNQDRYSYKAPVTLTNVEVSGPEAVIKALAEGGAKQVVVQLSLKDFDTPGEKTIRLRGENYIVPKDVIVTNPEQDIKVEVTDRG